MEMVVEIGAINDGVEHYYRCYTPAPTHWEGLESDTLAECLIAAEDVIVSGVLEAKREKLDFVAFGYEGSPHDIGRISVKVLND